MCRSELQCVVVCCSALQCVAVCCRVCAVCCSNLQSSELCHSVLQSVAEYCSVLQSVATSCSPNVLTPLPCDSLQHNAHTATACNTLRTLQQPATHYNRLHGIGLDWWPEEAPGDSVLQCVAVCDVDEKRHTCASSLDTTHCDMMLHAASSFDAAHLRIITHPRSCKLLHHDPMCYYLSMPHTSCPCWYAFR